MQISYNASHYWSPDGFGWNLTRTETEALENISKKESRMYISTIWDWFIIRISQILFILQLELHTLNASRSAYQSISFTPSFFDIYTVSSSSAATDSSPNPLQCSILIKAVLSVLRTPAASVDSLAVTLPSSDAAKIQFSLHCLHGNQLSFFFPISILFSGLSFWKWYLSPNSPTSNVLCRVCMKKVWNNWSIFWLNINIKSTTLFASMSSNQKFLWHTGLHIGASLNLHSSHCPFFFLLFAHAPIRNIKNLKFGSLLTGLKKIYWITCNSEPEVQHLSLDRSHFPSSLVVRPRDLSRLLSNFQSSLHEITIIATEPATAPPDVTNSIGGKAVELRSYIDPAQGSLFLSWNGAILFDIAFLLSLCPVSLYRYCSLHFGTS
jgi:Rad9